MGFWAENQEGHFARYTLDADWVYIFCACESGQDAPSGAGADGFASGSLEDQRARMKMKNYRANIKEWGVAGGR
jgi:hypothetical protein